MTKRDDTFVKLAASHVFRRLRGLVGLSIEELVKGTYEGMNKKQLAAENRIIRRYEKSPDEPISADCYWLPVDFCLDRIEQRLKLFKDLEKEVDRLRGLSRWKTFEEECPEEHRWLNVAPEYVDAPYLGKLAGQDQLRVDGRLYKIEDCKAWRWVYVHR